MVVKSSTAVGHGGAWGELIAVSGADRVWVDVRANADAEGRLVCKTPPRAAVAHRISATLNGQQFSAPLEYAYLPPTRLQRIFPRSGSADGGSSLTLFGSGFGVGTDADLLRCRIGATSVTARLLNETAVACATPSAIAAGREARGAFDFGTQNRSQYGAATEAAAVLGDGMAGTLYGDAQLLGGSLVLTQSVPHRRGAQSATASGLGRRD